MKEVNWAIIGCGDVTEIKSGPGLYKSEHSHLIGVYSRTFSKAVDYAKRHHVEKVYESVEKLLADDQIDVVYIATPPYTHKDFAMKVLMAHKIPYIEKPVASSYADVVAIKTLAEEKKLPVYVAFYRRGLAKYIKIKELLDAQVIGDIRFVRLQQLETARPSDLDKKHLPWRLLYPLSGGGKFVDMGVHMLDYLSFFFGNIVEMKGNVANTGGLYEVEDTVLIHYLFENGTMGIGTFCYVADKDENICQIIGSKGRISFDVMAADSFTLEKDGKKETFTFPVPQHIAMPYEQSIVNELIGKEKCNNNFENALSLTKAMEGLLQEYRHTYFVK